MLEPLDFNRPHSVTTHDVLGRAIQTTSPDGTYSTIEYDDWTTTFIDQNGHKQESDFDAFGQLVEKREYVGADGRNSQYPPSLYTLYATTQYFYDSAGHLLQVSDSSGNTVQMGYDVLGRKINMSDPDMGTWQYVYDLNGNLVKQVDGKGQTMEFAYDVLNRLIHKTDHGPLNVDYIYDIDTVSHGKSRLTSVQYGLNDSTQFAYDQLGREVQSIKTIDGKDYEVQRKYDALDRLTELDYPDQTKIFYKYNEAGQIVAIADDLNLLNDEGGQVP